MGYYENIEEEKRRAYLREQQGKKSQELAPIITPLVRQLIKNEIKDKLTMNLSISTSTESGDYRSYHSHTIRIQLSYDGEVIADTYEYFTTD